MVILFEFVIAGNHVSIVSFISSFFFSIALKIKTEVNNLVIEPIRYFVFSVALILYSRSA